MAQTIKPDKKLYTKSWLILLTVSVLILFTGLILVILVPLGKPNPSEVSAIVWPITFATILALWIFAGPIIFLWIKNLSYEIEKDRVIIYQGILTKVYKNIPYRAITDFVLHRSLFDRFLGIASVRIQTAGQTQTATGYEGNMAGLIEWERLHKDLRDRIKVLHTASEAQNTKESFSLTKESETLDKILNELKEIRKALEK